MASNDFGSCVLYTCADFILSILDRCTRTIGPLGARIKSDFPVAISLSHITLRMRDSLDRENEWIENQKSGERRYADKLRAQVSSKASSYASAMAVDLEVNGVKSIKIFWNTN